MDIIAKIRQTLMNPMSAMYECWMCGEVHNDAVMYLWHINACGIPAAERQREMIPVMIVKQ
jgi:hypothetical protein